MVRVTKSERADGVSSAQRRLRILLVEDHAGLRATLQRWLEESGHIVRAAEGCERALERAMELQPDVAFVDLGLPGISGFEPARRLQAHPETWQMGLVSMTALSLPDVRVQALKSTFVHDVAKPIDVEELGAILAEAVIGNRGTTT